MFARLMEEYGSQEEEEKREEIVATKQENKLAVPAEVKKGNKKLMQDEERLTGAVTWSVYSRYFKFAGGWMASVLPLVLFVVLSQVAQGTFLPILLTRSMQGSPLPPIQLQTRCSSAFGRPRAFMDSLKEITWVSMPRLVWPVVSLPSLSA